MTVKDILTPVITQEFEKYERHGYKIKLKSISKRRVKYSIICGIIALLGFAHPVYLAVIPVYIILMMKTRDNIGAILSKAKKSPDKSIEQIVAEEVKV